MFRKVLVAALLQVAGVSIVCAQETARFKEINKAFLSPNSKTVLIASHRGTHNDFPENSMAAFKRGIELGIDVLELDVRHTKDDSLVVMHDGSVDRTTNGTGKVSDLTFEEVRKLRLKFNGKLTDEQVPTLEEALRLAKGKILVDLDIKTPRVPQIMKVVDRTQTVNTTMFFLGRGEYAKMVKEQNAGIRTLVRTHRAADIDSLFAITKTEAVHIDPSHNTVEVTSKIKKNGGRVWINALGETDKKAAAGDLEAYGELLKNGANMVQTDYPALLMKYLKSKNLYYN
ncbi:glycerophosphodiester phosphodiesterase [Chitinophaga sp. SYP-B3965]|uniref:glycerophosphodiester phosphodiesterase family protein n=1 Tax=Chitinophaga sp. SYP-B3965 TaxID=2663120 RepID=UPI001299DCB4|nr:glycerophosphodiester phosphodiesterase family protein [Chitinophaga sp. SYP-B3965]MRG47944.1 glycerophosphodiester phosphodiesterase [Chitinophaga sp. SYP-B3965]